MESEIKGPDLSTKPEAQVPEQAIKAVNEALLSTLKSKDKGYVFFPGKAEPIAEMVSERIKTMCDNQEMDSVTWIDIGKLQRDDPDELAKLDHLPNNPQSVAVIDFYQADLQKNLSSQTHGRKIARLWDAGNQTKVFIICDPLAGTLHKDNSEEFYSVVLDSNIGHLTKQCRTLNLTEYENLFLEKYRLEGEDFSIEVVEGKVDLGKVWLPMFAFAEWEPQRKRAWLPIAQGEVVIPEAIQTKLDQAINSGCTLDLIEGLKPKDIPPAQKEKLVTKALDSLERNLAAVEEKIERQEHLGLEDLQTIKQALFLLELVPEEEETSKQSPELERAIATIRSANQNREQFDTTDKEFYPAALQLVAAIKDGSTGTTIAKLVKRNKNNPRG
jgi:hypothetical protein